MPSPRIITLGISTCPNDTFAFHAILTGKIEIPGVELRIELLDVQELNEKLFRGEFDVAKASFHAALLLAKEYGIFESGSALGFGVGPLLLAAKDDSRPAVNSPDITLCPGQHTTATLLYRLFYPDCGQLRQTVFSEIMPALVQKQAAFGVCIHEGRFTYQDQGLHCVEDLGVRWEATTGHPLPLGGILGKLDLEPELLANVQRAIAASIEYSHQNRDEALVSMRKYAQEFSDEVLFSHVDLYVNEWTTKLGSVGRAAIEELHRRAIASGAITQVTAPRVLGGMVF